jgi:hypothetical protein
LKNKNIIAVQQLIRTLDIQSLKNPLVIANLVRAFGIVQWGPEVFGQDELFKNKDAYQAGIYQTPDQIAKALVYLSDFPISTYLEVGVFQGGNFLFVSEYLHRFNPNIRCIGIDPTAASFLNNEIQWVIEKEVWITFKPITSDSIQGQEFDVVFIDGEHTTEWINKDWNNVGKFAKLALIHDIQETTCPDIIEFWSELKKSKKKTVEFLDCTSSVPTQGIGIIHNQKLGSTEKGDSK